MFTVINLVTRSCTDKGDFQIASDVIQAPKLWELEDGALRSDGLRMEHYTAFTAEQAARGAAGRRPASVV